MKRFWVLAFKKLPEMLVSPLLSRQGNEINTIFKRSKFITWYRTTSRFSLSGSLEGDLGFSWMSREKIHPPTGIATIWQISPVRIPCTFYMSKGEKVYPSFVVGTLLLCRVYVVVNVHHKVASGASSLIRFARTCTRGLFLYEAFTSL